MSLVQLRKRSLRWMLGPGMDEIAFFKKWSDEVTKLRTYHRIYEANRRKTNPDYKRINRESYHRHRDRRIADARKCREDRKADPVRLEKYRAWCRNRVKARAATDIQFHLRRKLRGRILQALHGLAKTGTTLELVGCSMAQFKTYIESLWKPGMSWENYGLRGWHIDHIKPCASFDLTDPAQQRACFHYTNVQPLWWSENLSKGDKP